MTKLQKPQKIAKKKPMSHMIKLLDSLTKDLGYKTNSVDLLRKYCGRG